MQNLKTTIHSYYFDTRNPEEKAAYLALAKELKARGSECFETWGGNGHYNYKFKNGLDIELETSSLFENQWNTAPIPDISDSGLRVFDWAQDYPIDFSKSIKRGHYLELTDEMREIRRNVHKCGYCGKQEPAQKGYVFCPHCIGSSYLKSSDLPLLRMMPVEFKGNRAPLTEAEKAHLLPIYKEAQLHGNTERDKKRIADDRANLTKKRDKAIYIAETEFTGFSWLMDHGIKTDNCIYYSHTDRFCFGWRNPVDAEFLSELLDVVSEFPFAYDIKTQDGRTLSGD